MGGYAHPEALVSTQWVSDHIDDANVRVVEVDVDTEVYKDGHLPGAIAWSWTTQLRDSVLRDIIPKSDFEELMSCSGIANDSIVVLYGDNNNWFAAWAFWQLKIYGHEEVRLMNGGRNKWIDEGRPIAEEVPETSMTSYQATGPDSALRAFLGEVRAAVEERVVELVDVRSPQEFSGEVLAPPGMPETCQRGGHIPGARNITWSRACNEDGTFKSFEALSQLYEDEGITGTKPIITYCRIGERSSHSWFVLKYLLGFDRVANYDGSWTEWGNLVGAPIEKP